MTKYNYVGPTFAAKTPLTCSRHGLHWTSEGVLWHLYGIKMFVDPLCPESCEVGVHELSSTPH